MADSEFFDLITSEKWRDALSELILKGEHAVVGLKDGSYGRDPYLVLQDCLVHDKKIPGWVGWKILEDRKRKKGGRHFRPEERARQQAVDTACWLAVEDGMLNHGLKRTPAEARAAQALHLSRQAVHDARKREENRLRRLGLDHPEGWTTDGLYPQSSAKK